MSGSYAMSTCVSSRVDSGGCGFLGGDTDPADVLVPEAIDETHRLIAKSARAFVDHEILPRVPAIEGGDLPLVRELMAKAGALGLAGFELPARFGGLGLGKVANALVTAQVARCPSFAVTHAVHTGLASYAILYLGDESQRARHLPALASAERIAALACTEPEAGSDIFGIRTVAAALHDGAAYRLRGSKMWISNAGLADLFVVLAKVDGKHPTFFAVPRETPGLTTGPEESKLGIRGSSTRAVYLDEVEIPLAERIGRVGSGQLGFLGILNHARFKLASGCIGLCRETLELAAGYALQRRQFGSPIASFPAVGAMLAEMAVRVYVGEAAVLRGAGLIDAWLQGADPDGSASSAAALQEHTAECSLLKVLGSESADRCVDLCVQVHGGMGVSGRAPAERFYRDARVFRIFEGSNEMMRLVAATWIGLRVRRGEIPLDAAPGPADDDPARATVRALRGAFAWLAERVLVPRTPALPAQELLLVLADLALELFATESAWLRGRRVAATGDAGELASDLVALQADASWRRAEAGLREASVQLGRESGDEVGLLGPRPRVDAIAARRRVAAALIRREGRLSAFE